MNIFFYILYFKVFFVKHKNPLLSKYFVNFRICLFVLLLGLIATSPTNFKFLGKKFISCFILMKHVIYIHVIHTCIYMYIYIHVIYIHFMLIMFHDLNFMSKYASFCYLLKKKTVFFTDTADLDFM